MLGWRCRRRAFRRAGGNRNAEHISLGWRRWRRIFREWWRTTFRWAGGGDGAHFVKLAATAQISVRWRQWRRTFRQAGGRGASAHFVMQKFIGPGFAVSSTNTIRSAFVYAFVLPYVLNEAAEWYWSCCRFRTHAWQANSKQVSSKSSWPQFLGFRAGALMLPGFVLGILRQSPAPFTLTQILESL